jgi:MoaA/NifB/PqqE/SkfB family radical SAM enzyme
MDNAYQSSIIEPDFLSNIGFVLTYKCQVACPHCLLEAGPNRTEEVKLEDALEWISQIAKYRRGYVKMISLTGGEPFFDIDKLKKIARFGKKNGLTVTAITNAFWADSVYKAEDILADLPEIEKLGISTDKYHVKDIPFERVKNAIAAVEKVGKEYSVIVCTESSEDAEYRELIEKLLNITKEENINTTVTFPFGRAFNIIEEGIFSKSPQPPACACITGGSPIIFPNGDVIGCIGPVINISKEHPLKYGNLFKYSLEDILNSAEKNVVLHTIRIWGPHKLVSIIQNSEYRKYLPNEYISDFICHTCYNLLNNDKLFNFYNDLQKSEEYAEMIAYARIYYLKETQMAEMMGLRENGDQFL